VGEVGHSPLNSENAPLRGEKNTLYEGGVRVCAFANWPGVLEPRKFTTPMHCVDWFPTIAALAGYEPAEDLRWDGVNQWPALTGQAAASPERSIYIAMRGGGAAVRRGDWKLINRPGRVAELYNLAKDPYETTDLAAREAALVSEMRALIAAERAKDEPKLPEGLEEYPE
jgi:arylsulfatase A-like enzyme